jgi:ATP phosphoribosyltransferase regulatory subunit
MPGKSSRERLALETQNGRVMAVFEKAGFDHIAPDLIQPADLFLESSGEEIRASTFLFTDPEGRELCLRPDLTVPACRYHLTHAARPDAEARYCYCGPAFRFTGAADHNGELGQAGIEWLSSPEPQQAEAKVLALAIAAVEAAGLKNYRVKLGDLGFIAGLLDGIAMPKRWRRRLMHHFWRPQAFHETLERFATGATGARSSISQNVDLVDGRDAGEAPRIIAETLALQSVPLNGGRSVEEIAARLMDKAADRTAHPLPRTSVETIDRYLAIEGDAAGVATKLAAISDAPAFKAALARYQSRLKAIAAEGLKPKRFHFSAPFGRNLEYYTGFVFQIEALTQDGAVQVAGGGRYDDLLSDIGSPVKVPAVGCAIDTGRLLASVSAST